MTNDHEARFRFWSQVCSLQLVDGAEKKFKKIESDREATFLSSYTWPCFFFIFVYNLRTRSLARSAAINNNCYDRWIRLFSVELEASRSFPTFRVSNLLHFFPLNSTVNGFYLESDARSLYHLPSHCRLVIFFIPHSLLTRTESHDISDRGCQSSVSFNVSYLSP